MFSIWIDGNTVISVHENGDNALIEYIADVAEAISPQK